MWCPGHGRIKGCSHKYNLVKSDKMPNSSDRYSHLYECIKCGAMHRTFYKKLDESERK